MKALSIREPYASFIRVGIKHFETRAYRTNYRGPIAIHAARKYFEGTPAEARLLWTVAGGPCMFPGHVVAVADLTDCIEITEDFTRQLSNAERWAGFYTVGRYAWKLENVRPVDPVAARGFPGLWTLNIDEGGIEYGLRSGR